MVAGGGASVIYSDTICDLGGASELANYGEYSGAPSEQQTYEYAKTILSLMTQEKHPEGKVRCWPCTPMPVASRDTVLQNLNFESHHLYFKKVWKVLDLEE